MKVSLNLAQYYSNVDLKSISHSEWLEKIGAQLGAVEESTEWASKYIDIIVVKIVSVSDHPDADRLHICMIDDGGKASEVPHDENGLVQVVCGAPNVRPGIYVAWIPQGATLPTTYGSADPFILGTRDLRGVTSNGMLASAKELGSSDDHDGILEIDPLEVGKTPQPGEPFTDYFGMDDFIIDCENKMFTHRPDCFGNLGVARELAGISGKAFKSPDWYSTEPQFETKSTVQLHVTNEVGPLVPRLMAVAMNSVTVGKSPVWLQAQLARVGIKTINNVVDVTNYVMHLTGQPLHAYDADKLGSTVVSRMAREGEKVALLNGKTVELSKDDIVIANDQQVVGLAGIMGGKDTEVDEQTKNIIIECATFDMYTIRRSSMRLGIFSDASTRYTKGQSPLQNNRVLNYAMKIMQEHTGAEQTSNIYDIHATLEQPADVIVTAQFINDRLGSNLSGQDIAQLLENVEFVVKTVPADKNHLHIRPPFWRTDIELPEDIVEEVGRLYGYDKLPVTLPVRLSSPAVRNTMLDFKQHLRQSLAAAGANEVLTYSFVHGDLLRKTGTNPEDSAYHIRNALSPELQYFRTSLMPSLLSKVTGNIRSDSVRGDDNEFALFEIGKAHSKDQLDEDKLPRQMERLSLVVAADAKTAQRNYTGSAYFMAKQHLQTIVKQPLQFVPYENDGQSMSSPLQLGRSSIIKLNDTVIGVVGEIDELVKKALKLPDYCAGFELDIVALHNHIEPHHYEAVGQFPKIQQDITFEVDQNTTYGALYSVLSEKLGSLAQEHGYKISLMPRDIFQAEDSDSKRLTFSVWISHPNRTLKTAETNQLLNTVADNLRDVLGAERI